MKLRWGGFNLEYGNLENGKLKAILISKITAMGISKKSNGYLEFSLENGSLKKCVRNQPVHRCKCLHYKTDVGN